MKRRGRREREREERRRRVDAFRQSTSSSPSLPLFTRQGVRFRKISPPVSRSETVLMPKRVGKGDEKQKKGARERELFALLFFSTTTFSSPHRLLSRLAR